MQMVNYGLGGANRFGELGTGEGYTSSPVQVGSLTDWDHVSSGSNHTHAIKTDGTLWAWGRNSFYGILGDGTTVDKSSPVQIGSLTDWALLSKNWGSLHSAAIKTDGTLWTWGYNVQGQLGDGTTVNKSSPVQIGSLTDWANVSVGAYTCWAIKTDGTLWAWGNGGNGILGDGTTVNKSSPVQMDH
jgi:alpha-tubulin suppressor-like RCC1 family protein